MTGSRITDTLTAIGKWAVRISLLVASVVVALAALEVAARLTMDPMDYLLPELVTDARLGHRVAPGSAHHDDWGFRNAAVPQSAPIVAIGDSLTYGWNARASDSWPAFLARMTGVPVYNMSMGDYGPGQYEVLLEDEAATLSPKTVLIGFYLGNDLVDAWKYVYVLGARPDLKLDDPELQPKDVKYTTVTDRLADEDALTRARGWLARNSVMYRIATNSVLGAIARLLESRVVATQEAEYSVLSGGDFGPGVVLDPVGRGKALDLDDPRVSEGLRLSLVFLEEMKGKCDEIGASCAVVLLPTKERVFADEALGRPDLKHGDALMRLVSDEAAVVGRIKSQLDAIGMPYVDLLRPFETLRSEGIYSTNQDIHPNARGYGVIAEEVATAMPRWRHGGSGGGARGGPEEATQEP
jgi:hypothetical protein